MLYFKGRHFSNVIMLMAVRWHTAYALSYRHIEELMDAPEEEVDHATLQRWVAEYSPDLMERARKVMKTSADLRRMAEKYIKVKGGSTCIELQMGLYRKLHMSQTKMQNALSSIQGRAMGKLIYNFNISEKPALGKVGGKAQSLIATTQAGLPVPGGRALDGRNFSGLDR